MLSHLGRADVADVRPSLLVGLAAGARVGGVGVEERVRVGHGVHIGTDAVGLFGEERRVGAECVRARGGADYEGHRYLLGRGVGRGLDVRVDGGGARELAHH